MYASNRSEIAGDLPFPVREIPFVRAPRQGGAPDASGNHIRNCGAVSGYSNFSTRSLEFARHTASGNYVDWRGVAVDSRNEISIDRSTAHIVRCSRILVKKAEPYYGRLHFNPVPRRAVSPFRLLPNAAMRLSTLVNICNGRERAGFLELTPGIGHRKMPGQWMDLVLLP